MCRWLYVLMQSPFSTSHHQLCYVPCMQFQDPAQTSPVCTEACTSFRAIDVRPGGMELLAATHNSDLWQINPTTAATALTANTAVVTSSNAAEVKPTPSSASASHGSLAEGPDAAAVLAAKDVSRGSLPEALIQGHTGDVYGIAYHPKKPHVFVTACESNHIFLWHAKRKQLIVSLLREISVAS